MLKETKMKIYKGVEIDSFARGYPNPLPLTESQIEKDEKINSLL